MIIPARYMKPIDPEARKKLYEHQQKVLKGRKKLRTFDASSNLYQMTNLAK